MRVGVAQFDISKIPDIYDILKYYRIHNSCLELPGVADVYHLSKALADIVVPQEYGITADEKRTIGTEITHHLLRKLMFDLTAGRPGVSNVPVPPPSVASGKVWRLCKRSLEWCCVF